MNELNERTSGNSIFSFQRLIFRYRLAAKFLDQGRTLDIGCGAEGEIFKYISQNNYVGIDYSLESIKKMSSKFTEANFLYQKAPPLNFPDSYFDNILCLEMIEHLSEEKGQLLLDEIGRCLKKGGKLFLSTPNAANRGKDFPEGHLKEYNVNEIVNLIENKGFTILKKTGLFLSIFKKRYKKNSFFLFRKSLYKSLEVKPQEDIRKKNPFNNLKKYFHSSSKKTIKYILNKLAKFICFMGFIFPNKAEYQVYLAEKK